MGFFSLPPPQIPPTLTTYNTQAQLKFHTEFQYACFNGFIMRLFCNICFTVYWNLIIMKSFIIFKKIHIYIYKIMHFARFDFLITMSKLAWLYYKIFLYPYILHYLCEIFCCEILKNIPLPLKFLYQKKISWVNIYWMWLHVDDSFKIKKKKKVNL